jgi:hypothetical protein
MTQLPRDLISVRARRIACKEAYQRLATFTAAAAELGISRQSVAYFVNGHSAAKKREAMRFRYYCKVIVPREMGAAQ